MGRGDRPQRNWGPWIVLIGLVIAGAVSLYMRYFPRTDAIHLWEQRYEKAVALSIYHNGTKKTLTAREDMDTLWNAMKAVRVYDERTVYAKREYGMEIPQGAELFTVSMYIPWDVEAFDLETGEGVFEDRFGYLQKADAKGWYCDAGPGSWNTAVNVDLQTVWDSLNQEAVPASESELNYIRVSLGLN